MPVDRSPGGRAGARPMLVYGSRGPAVREAQTALNGSPPSALPRLAVDGIFGPRTLARVKEFQSKKGLKADGIVGPKTWGALLGGKRQAPPPLTGVRCGTGDPQNRTAGFLVRREYFSLRSGGSLGAPGSGQAFESSSLGGSSPIRMLTPAQKAAAKGVYGESLDFSRIFISDKTGLQSRPFTVAFPDSNEVVQIMNCGAFEPRYGTLIHELAHVWQSQHHSDPYRFMANAVDCQAGAVVANGHAALEDLDVLLHHEYPVNFPFSAYAYPPGLNIAAYGAEQMAKAAEKGDEVVRAHMKSKARNAVDPDNITALSRPSFADRRMKGIVI